MPLVSSGVRVGVVLALSVLASMAQSHFPAEIPSGGETSELQVYPRATQIGVVARRTIRDRTGRIAREVFYGSSLFNSSEVKEKDLRVQSISVYFNDAEGRVDRVEHWEPSKRSPRVEHNAYSPSGELTRKWYVDNDGVRRYEIRFSGSKSVAELYYDDTGKYLRSIRGRLVSDVDLPHGWGEVKGGLSCAITLSTDRGHFEDVAVWVTVKNVGSEMVMIQNLAQPTFELRDSAGKMITLREMSSTPAEKQLYGQLLETGEAGFDYPAYRLADYFDRLQPGEYTIRIRQPLAERSVELISNDVTFVVL